MVEMNGCTAVAARNSTIMARRRRTGIFGMRAALLALSAAMAMAEGRGARADGTVVAWGRNDDGQCNTPTELGGVTAIDGGQNHTVALSADGSVLAWGSNSVGQCNTPAGLGVVAAIAAGEIHTVVLKADGSVVAWGSNANGQCNTPADLGRVNAIDAGSFHTIVLKADGTVASWGSNGNGQCDTPAGLDGVNAIAAGYYHTLALNCPTPTHSRTSGNLGAIGSGSPREFTFDSLPPAASSIALTIRARADLNLATEFLIVRLDGVPFTNIFIDTGNDCPSVMDEVVLSLTAKQFNAFIADDALTVRLEAPSGVNAAQCADGACEIELFYETVPVDCNDNGIEDSCEVSNPAFDCNDNGVPDSCDIASGVSIDINANTRPDECEFDCNSNGLPDAYEIAQGLALDCNNNGRLDSCELAEPGSNRIANGNFDADAAGWTSSHIDFAGGWRSSGGHPGGMFILNDGGAASSDPSIEQTALQLTPGIVYTISGDFIGASTASSPAGSVSFAVDVNGVTVLTAPATDTVSWRSFSVDFMASSTSAQIRFRAETNGTDNDFSIDNIAVMGKDSVPDCNGNSVPDSCDIAAGSEFDCNSNGVPDSCDIASGTASDVDRNNIPDSCQGDCNGNSIPDTYEALSNPSLDCDADMQLDACEISEHPELDCDQNGTLDSCDSKQQSEDCNNNGALDTCDITNGAQDKDADGRLDECEIALGDFNLDDAIGAADLADLLSLWGFTNPPYGDLNGDGVVGAADLTMLLAGWGPLY